jgi:TfoX/Sxy family transcriptional regulator of competence genes
MFGGLSFLVDGHMCCGVQRDRVVVRVPAEAADAAIDAGTAKVMDFTGRPLRGFVYLNHATAADDAQLAHWLALAEQHARLQPPRQGR